MGLVPPWVWSHGCGPTLSHLDLGPMGLVPWQGPINLAEWAHVPMVPCSTLPTVYVKTLSTQLHTPRGAGPQGPVPLGPQGRGPRSPVVPRRPGAALHNTPLCTDLTSTKRKCQKAGAEYKTAGLVYRQRAGNSSGSCFWPVTRQPRDRISH